MGVLHLLANPAAAESCLAAAADGDALLLLGDGVFAAARLGAAAANLHVGALREDAEQRGATLHDAQALEDADFVDWVVANHHSVTWT